MFGSLVHLKKYFLKYKQKLLIGLVCILLSNLGLVYIPLILKDAIEALEKNLSQETIIRYALIIVGTVIVSGFFRFLIRQTIIVMSRDIEYDLRQDFWAHIQKLPLRFFQNNSTGSIMSHATNDISAVRMFVGPSVMYSIDNGIRFIIVITIMLSLNTSLTLYALIPLPILSSIVYLVMKKVHSRYTRIQEKFAELTSKAQENFAGIRVIKSYVREEFEINEFRKHSQEYLDRKMDLVRLYALFMPVFSLIAGLSSIIVLWLGGKMVINNEMTLGTISAFFAYLVMLIWPMISFGWVANMIQQAEASMKRIMKIFNEPVDIANTEATDFIISKINGSIQFENVSFRYSENLPYVFENLSFKINHGETVAFIGSTGVGKTTLINLIPRMYDITGGRILIDGNDIKKIPLEILRRHIGMVPQENFLFSDTLANNIIYGVESNDEELVESVSDIAQLKKDVDSFPKGYETILGERGITLSGGQKQRSSLARALAINPSILILDDSFSAVDTHTEEEILKRLKEFMKQRTSIIISHRISTVKDSDKIFVLDKGRIAEEGNHEQLIKLNGIYTELYTKQLLEEELSEMA
ncbi:MAG: ABC transporter ATP-binding protein [Melioribacteraceae bacterium]|nr:ABC transporter ATP-binding protein [Melioribacteraceae bacterium]RJP61363.1 MAG: ABC transporter ATP-binding protein [Ignavibacteriales bacterium]